MNDFGQNNQWPSEGRIVNEPGIMQQAPRKKNRSPQIFLLSLAVTLASCAAYYFWPAAKGIRPAAAAPEASKKELPLTAIVYSQDSALAIVNGEIVHEEDMIEDVKVIKIHPDRVEFELSGSRWSQTLPDVEDGVHSGLPMLLELGSQGCPPCRQMMPILDELKAKYDDKFHIRCIDVWQDRATGRKYGVTKIPTQIFFDQNGSELFRHVGFYSKKDILATWKKLGIKL
ncbi:MAG: thioredoxin fold domain-containing protein [Planctomycetota bacterium]|jgi:thioredoxin 1